MALAATPLPAWFSPIVLATTVSALDQRARAANDLDAELPVGRDQVVARRMSKPSLTTTCCPGSGLPPFFPHRPGVLRPAFAE